MAWPSFGCDVLVAQPKTIALRLMQKQSHCQYNGFDNGEVVQGGAALGGLFA